MDDTARKHLDDALTRSNADLQQFAFIASHDLQEPLRTICSLAQLLKQRFSEQLDPEIQKIVGFMLEAADRMSRLVTDLLAFSQLALGESHVTSVHLDEDLETAKSLLRSRIEATGAIMTHDQLPNVEVERNQMVHLSLKIWLEMPLNSAKKASLPVFMYRPSDRAKNGSFA